MSQSLNNALNTQSTLEKIELPKTDDFQPKQLSAVSAAFALAARKLDVAEREIARIKQERIDRDKKIEQLELLLASFESQIIDIWCCTYSDQFKVGDVVQTAEVPGHYLDVPELRVATLYPMTADQITVAYYERSINIGPQGVNLPVYGRLKPANSLGSAAVFYNLAMEPGHEKWKPLWRYGVLTSSDDYIQSTSLSNVTLNAIKCRFGDELSGMTIDADINLVDVPIVYPPCHGRIFQHDDEVLIRFDKLSRVVPKIIGFRREPRQCPPTWAQLR